MTLQLHPLPYHEVRLRLELAGGGVLAEGLPVLRADVGHDRAAERQGDSVMRERPTRTREVAHALAGYLSGQPGRRSLGPGRDAGRRFAFDADSLFRGTVSVTRDEALTDPHLRSAVLAWDARDDSAYVEHRAGEAKR